MTISNLNYSFLKTCALKLKIQKKKLGIWCTMKTPAQKMVMGCNSLTGNNGRDVIYFTPGIREFKNVREVNMVFNRSFGFLAKVRLANGQVIDADGYAPTKFTLSNIDVFGSIWAENKWAGVRFYQN